MVSTQFAGALADISCERSTHVADQIWDWSHIGTVLMHS